MAKEKMITRTLVSGYEYEVIARVDGGFGTIGKLTTETPIRSIKQTEEVLKKNGHTGNEQVVLLGNMTKKYEMSEETFLKYATEIVEDSNENNEESKEV